MRKVASALLLGLAVTASSMAMAQDRGGGGPRGERGPGGGGGGQHAQPAPQAQSAPQAQPAPQAPVQRQQARPDGSGRDFGRGQGERPQFRGERRDGAGFNARVDGQDRGGQRVDIQRPGRPDGAPLRVENQRRDDPRGNGTDRRFDNRSPDGRQIRIDNQRRDDPRWRGNNNGDRFGDRGGPGWRGGGPGGNWNRGWRDDRRYDWQGYRSSNRSAFRQPRYVSPYNYGYRRFSAGIRLEPFFFAQRYWISDPYAYRLPPAYEPYRWVRYYDDVLLVDLRTGEVVDVIPDFFW